MTRGTLIDAVLKYQSDKRDIANSLYSDYLLFGENERDF